MVASGNDEARRRAVENGILPTVRIAGEDVHWSLAERMAHYKVPGVSIAVIEGGEIAWAKGYGSCGRDNYRRSMPTPFSWEHRPANRLPHSLSCRWWSAAFLNWTWTSTGT